MFIKLYQINMSRDKARMCFESMEFINAYCETIHPESYDEVFKGIVDCNNLEDVYRMFNADDRPGTDQFRSLSVSDVVAVCDPDTDDERYYFCDSIGFKEIEFDASKAKPLQKNTIRVVLVEPGKQARIADIEASLEGYYRAIGADTIQAVYPFEEEVCIICDDEGKLTGRKLNRALRDEDTKEVYDIIAGTFFVCSFKEPRYTSLNTEQQRKYLNLYKWPEAFFNINGKIVAVPIKPKDRGEAR